MFNFSRCYQAFSTVAAPFHIPTSNVQDSNFSTSLPIHVLICFLLILLFFFFFGKSRPVVWLNVPQFGCWIVSSQSDPDDALLTGVLTQIMCPSQLS